MDICFATNNDNKVREVAALLPPSFSIKTLKSIGCNEELPEEQDTLEGNSRQKAGYVFDNYGITCFADDTGLEVKQLGGRPGVYSARYAGPGNDAQANMAKLLDELDGEEDREARFRTVITLIHSKGEIQFEGKVDGRIALYKSGEEGFGYDPVFIPDGFDRSFAEMSASEKNAISHRGLAVAKLVEYLQSHENDLISDQK
jgi:XTP/dITP diphosphohydrolase